MEAINLNIQLIVQHLHKQDERIQVLESEVKKLTKELKRKRSTKDPFGDPTRITEALRRYVFWLPEEINYRERATKEFLDHALVEDPNEKVAADEFLSYLMDHYIEEDVLFEVSMLPDLMTKFGYSSTKIDGKTYFEGLSWNPDYEKEPLVDREPLNIRKNDADTRQRKPVYRYPWLWDPVIKHDE